MKYSELVPESWDQLQSGGNPAEGYFGIFIKGNNDQDEKILIFKDEGSKLHFVIESGNFDTSDVPNPMIHGLSVSIRRYRFKEIGVRSFIDLECNDQDYRPQFTAFVKAISEMILDSGREPLPAISEVLSVWRSFWTSNYVSSLSEDEQVGLMCEIEVLRKVCESDMERALTYWRGPLRDKQDFLFVDVAMEVKGSRNGHHRHVVNGLDQLQIPRGKHLSLASFLAARVDREGAKCLPEVINDLSEDFFKGRPDLGHEFRHLLGLAGYSPFHDEYYRTVRFEIYDGRIYLVTWDFPRLTTENLIVPLDKRVSEIRYSIDLDDVGFTSIEKFQFSNLLSAIV